MISPKTLFSLLEDAAEQFPEKKGLFYKQEGFYTGLTYQSILDHVKQVAIGFQRLGFDPGDRVAILSGNRPEWVVLDMATLSMGLVNVPIYPSLSAHEIQYILNDSQAKAVVVESVDHLAKVLGVLGHCPTLERVVTLSDAQEPTQQVLAYQDMLVKNPAPAEILIWQDQRSRVKKETVASLVYTSGTTGNPKGVILTHGNFLANIGDLLAITPISDQDRTLSFLPLSHVFERTVGYYCALAVRASIYYAESIETLTQDLLLAKPTILVSVPRVFEKLHARLTDSMSGLKKRVLAWALHVGAAHHQEGKKTVLHTLQYQILDRLVYSKLRKKTGGQIRFFVSGGAPLSKDLGVFFMNLGLPILEGYGLTEASPVIACNRVTQTKFGTVGLPLPHMQVRLGEENELQVKGPNVCLGYFKKETANKDIFSSDGWLCTGDIAHIDPEGFISIIDRKKELLVLSNGKKITPQVLEERLRQSPYISQALMIGDKRSYLTALIVPYFPQLEGVAKSRGWAFSTLLELVLEPLVISFYEDIIADLLSDLAPFEQVKRFSLLTEEFSQLAEEVTPTLKLRRKVILNRQAALIEKMYA